jgi:hypothetical protein
MGLALCWHLTASVPSSPPTPQCSFSSLTLSWTAQFWLSGFPQLPKLPLCHPTPTWSSWGLWSRWDNGERATLRSSWLWRRWDIMTKGAVHAKALGQTQTGGDPCTGQPG